MMGKSDALGENIYLPHSKFPKPLKDLSLTSSLIRSAIISFIHIYAIGILRKAYFLAAILFLSFTVKATTYHVSAGGNDANNGLTTATAWRTILKVNRSIFKAGDSILFKRGDAWTDKLYITNSGTLSNPIVFSTYGTGNLPEFNNISSTIITLYHTQYVIIDGIKIIDNSISTTDHSITAKIGYAIILNNAPNCTIKNCDISLVGIGIAVEGASNNTTITSNHIYNLRMVVNTRTPANDDYGATPIVISTSKNAITYNRFEECWALSYDYGYDGGAVEFFGNIINNNSILYNTAINCNGFLEIGSGNMGEANNNIIAYNKIINNGIIGTFHNSGAFATSINNLQYYNNNIIETVKQYTKPGVMFSMSGSGTAGMVVLKNNIFWMSDNTNLASSKFNTGQMVHTNNIYRMSSGSLGITLGGAEMLSTTASVFTNTSGDPSNWNYALPMGSPAINFGTDVGLKSDFIGNPIIGNPDAGILEFSSHSVSNVASQPPKANAGPDQTIILPINTINLSGSGTDPGGTIASYLWTKISGPTACTIANINSTATSAIGLVQGLYKFEFKVTDANGAVGRDTMQVTVDAVAIKAGIITATANQAPTANSGGDQTITLPINTVSLNGSGKDADGTAVFFFWSKISGPSSGTITNPYSATTIVSGLVQGVYHFELRVTDSIGATGRDTMQVTVGADAIPKIAPVANAGQNQTITLPTNVAFLSGRGTDADGTIVGYTWGEVSGPSISWISSPNAQVTLASNLVEGTYEFELTVTDNMGVIGRDTVVVVVGVAGLGHDVQSNYIKIYPNPVSNTATLVINTTTANSKLLVVITNMQGQIVYRNELASGQDKIQDILNLSNLSKGAYALTVYFGNQEKQTIKVMRMDP